MYRASWRIRIPCFRRVDDQLCRSGILRQETWSFTSGRPSRDWYPGKRKESMSRTIEAIMRHMAAPSNGVANQRNGTEKLEKEITVRKRHYIWAEARFVRAMMPFHANVRVRYNGKEVDGKNVLDLMTLAAPEGATVRIRTEGPDAAKAIHAVEQLVRSRSD